MFLPSLFDIPMVYRVPVNLLTHVYLYFEFSSSGKWINKYVFWINKNKYLFERINDNHITIQYQFNGDEMDYTNMVESMTVRSQHNLLNDFVGGSCSCFPFSYVFFSNRVPERYVNWTDLSGNQNVSDTFFVDLFVVSKQRVYYRFMFHRTYNHMMNNPKFTDRCKEKVALSIIDDFCDEIIGDLGTKNPTIPLIHVRDSQKQFYMVIFADYINNYNCVSKSLKDQVKARFSEFPKDLQKLCSDYK